MPRSSDDHAFGVRPIDRIEAPIALGRPMEEVDDDHGQRHAPALVLPRHAEQLILGLVPQLALPEAHGELRHHGRPSGHARVALQDLPRAVRGRHPVVKRLARGCAPDRAVLGEGDSADRGIVPQEAVPEARQAEGYARLRVAVRELELRAFQVEVRLLILAHAGYPFLGRKGFEAGRNLVVPAYDGAELACLKLQG